MFVLLQIIKPIDANLALFNSISFLYI